MRLNKWIYFVIGLLGIGAMGCDEQEPEGFDDVTGIYFCNYSAGTVLKDSASLTFVYESGDTLDVPVSIQLLGRPSAQARPVDIRIHSENAVEGVDYVLKTVAEMPANSASFNYIISLKRTPALKQEERTILLELHANDYFTLPLPYQVQAGGDTTSILQYRIIFSDRFTVAPEGWREEYGGVFSQQKFELVCRVLNLEPGSFAKKNEISYSKWSYIQTEMKAYVKEQVEKKAAGEPCDEEAFDKETGEPFEFTLK